jgi:gluconate 5-dehydrogenase
LGTPLEKLFGLEGKTAVVTGAAGFLGRTFCDSLLLAGARVVMMGRGEKLASVAAQFRSDYGHDRVDPEAVDFSDTDAYQRALESIAKRVGSIDILVNNAFEFSKETGFNDPSGRLESLSKNQWMRALESGIYWQALATQTLIPRMAERGEGSIINVSSMYALVSPDPALYAGTAILNPPTYSASKAALLALTRYTAAFYGRRGIRCNALLPGAFPNTKGDSYNAPSNEDFLKRLSDRTVLGRYGDPSDLRGAIIFLASDASRYMTGQCVSVDGGWTIR